VLDGAEALSSSSGLSQGTVLTGITLRIVSTTVGTKTVSGDEKAAGGD